MTDKNSLIKDHLDRGKFLTTLQSNIIALSKIPPENLATPPVIAVDAPWGNGKTWVANQLMKTAADSGHMVSKIDVFRYDHHDDAFAVIASSIYETLKPNDSKKRKLLAAAGEVMKIALPAAAKTALNLGAAAVGLGPAGSIGAAAFEAASDGTGTLTTKAVEKIFDSYSSTEKIHRKFIASLGELTKDLEKPLVVVIDELDRCRPSFALEFLERIKHLFDVPKVVFVLFWNSEAMHESIRHTYGSKTNAESYLAKFVAFSVALELPTSSRSKKIGSKYQTFLRGTASTYLGDLSEDILVFLDAMSVSCEVLTPKLREIQRAVQLSVQLEAYSSGWHDYASYLILLKSIDESRFQRLVKQDSSAAAFEANAFAPHLNAVGEDSIASIRAALMFLAKPEHFDELAKAYRSNSLRSKPGVSDDDLRILDKADFGDNVKMFTITANQISKLVKFDN